MPNHQYELSVVAGLSYEMTRCYLFQELAITLAWPDYMQHFQELLMQKPWLKITSNSLELIFLALKSQNFQTTHHNLPKKSISLG